MASQRLAVFLILLFAGHEVLAMRQRVKHRAGAAFASDLLEMVKEGDKMKDGLESRASCDKDIIVESSDGQKKLVLASEYKKEPVQVLTKYAKDKSHATYQLACSGGKAAVSKTSSSGKVSERPFDTFHWWRDTEIKSHETEITFSDYFGWPSMTSGKVTFTPSGNSCEEDQSAVNRLGSEVVSMLNEDRVRNFRKVSLVLREYANKQREMKAMGCPSHMITVDASIAEAMEVYFTKNQGGRDSPMAESRFEAALEKIKSVSVPTKADFAEVVALMKYGSCPEAKETRASADSIEALPEEVDESEDDKLEADVEACFAEEDCSALEGRSWNRVTSLLQQGDLAVAESAHGAVGFLANFLVFIAIFILCIVFWPLAWFIIMVWLLSLLLLTPFTLLSGPTYVYHQVTYHLGAFDYLVDEFCRPFIHSTGFPLRKMSDGTNKPAQLAPPVKNYVTYRGGALYDDRTGWPIAMMDDGVVKPLVGLPRPATDESSSD